MQPGSLDSENGVIQLGGDKTKKRIPHHHDSDGEMSSPSDDEGSGLMLRRNSHSKNGYSSVPTNQVHRSGSRRKGCCLWFFGSLILMIALVGIAVGLTVFWLSNHPPQTTGSNSGTTAGSSSPSSWFQSGSRYPSSSSSSSILVSNMDTKTFQELLKETDLTTDNSRKHTVRYDPSVYLANDSTQHNPFDWSMSSQDTENSWLQSIVTPPQLLYSNPNDNTVRPAAYLQHPHLVNNQLVFCAEGDAYVTRIATEDPASSKLLPAMKLTTTIGNVLDPKWHPTLAIMAYTATYSGRRDVYLMDLRPSSASVTPMRLTYWDIGGGVYKLVGWVKTNDQVQDDNNAYSLVFQAMSNDISLPDYRLYMIHLDTTQTSYANRNRHRHLAAPNPPTQDSVHAVMEVEPIPLAQATDATRWRNCWYFVRVKQSSSTIRYVGGTAENLWKYCDKDALSQPLFSDDDYKGTSKDPQLFYGKPQQRQDAYLFFLSDRGHDPKNAQQWIPDRMNLWALPLQQNKKNYSTKDLIQITDTTCDFEGKTIREYSVDVVTGNLVVRIGADLYIMTQDKILAKLKNKGRALADDSNNDTNKEQQTQEGNKQEDNATNDEKTDAPQQPDAPTQQNEKTDAPQQPDAPTQKDEKTEAPNQNQPDAKESIESPDAKGTTPDTTAEDNKEKGAAIPEGTTTPPSETGSSIVPDVVADEVAKDDDVASLNSTEAENATKPEAPKYYYDYNTPELISRSVNTDDQDHFSGHSSDLSHLPIVVYSDFSNQQERILPVEIVKHYNDGDIFDTVSQSTQMLLTLRGQLWATPVVDDALPPYEEAGMNLPARQYRLAPGAMMGGATRVRAARHVPNPVEDNTSDRRLAVVLATDPLTATAEHAFYLVEVQPGATPLFIDNNHLPKPFLGGMVSGGSTKDGGLGSVKHHTLTVSPCGNRMAWSDTDGRIVVMNLPQYQELEDPSQPAKYTVLPQENELGEPMVGDEVALTFSPGGRYLAVEHHARNQFLVISIVDLGDPLGAENKIAEISVGRIVQATPARFNSMSVYWGQSPTDMHDFARDQKMAELFGLKEPEDVSTTIYFLSDRDIKTDVSSPWGDRQKMPHFTDSVGLYALPLKALDAESSRISGQFVGGGAEEAHVKELLERKNLLQALLKAVSSASRRQLEESIHPLAGAFGFAEQAFNQKQKHNDQGADSNARRLDGSEAESDEAESHLKAAVFPKDMDINFGPVDLSFARQAYRVANIPEGNYKDILCQIPDDGSLVLIEDSGEEHGDVVKVFLTDDFPSDKYGSKTFIPTVRKLTFYQLSTSREYFFLIFVPDGAIRVVPNSLKGIAELLGDLALDFKVADWEGLHLSIWPNLEYRQMYNDAWRMMRDYFYDPGMTGIDWPTIHERYLPLVDRCTKREELDDVLQQLASELSALHVFVYGGEYPSPVHEDKDLENVNDVASLGASLKRTPEWKGYTVMSIPEVDPDYAKIDQKTAIYSPLSDHCLRLSGQRGLQVGDVIVGVNGESVMTVPDIHMLLRGKAGKSVRLDVLRLASGNDTNETTSTKKEEDAPEAVVEPLITVPLDSDTASDLLYLAWEWKTEQLAQELAAKAGITVGYIHLQDMSGPEGEDAFARSFFPNYRKQGLILDVRHNRGGNIDSWILDYLQRKPWSYWKGRAFNVTNGGLGWDEQYAFRGHVVVLIDEKTSSDGEGVSRGIKELGLGRLIGTRTWGGGIWLASDNKLVDGGIATAPEIGVYNEHIGWGLDIEQMGVDPDIVVDNDPHETFTGSDKQLERAIAELKKWIDEEPVVLPFAPEKTRDMTMGDRECKANK